MMMNSAYPVPLPGTSMETVNPESRRCLRRIFFLVHHSPNTEARLLSLAESGSALIGASLPRVARGGFLRVKDNQPKKDNHDDSNYLFVYHGSPKEIRFDSHRICAWHPCACPRGGSIKIRRPMEAMREAIQQKGRAPCLILPAAHSTPRLVCFRSEASLIANSTLP